MNKILNWALLITASLSVGMACTTNVYNEKTLEALATVARQQGQMACTDISAPPALVGRYCLLYSGPTPTPSGSPTP